MKPDMRAPWATGLSRIAARRSEWLPLEKWSQVRVGKPSRAKSDGSHDNYGNIPKAPRPRPLSARGHAAVYLKMPALWRQTRCKLGGSASPKDATALASVLRSLR